RRSSWTWLPGNHVRVPTQQRSVTRSASAVTTQRCCSPPGSDRLLRGTPRAFRGRLRRFGQCPFVVHQHCGQGEVPTDAVTGQVGRGVLGILGTGERHEHPQPLGPYRIDPVDDSVSLVCAAVTTAPLYFRLLTYPVGGHGAG